MGCDSEIATQKDRSAECSVTFQLHRGGSIDLTGSLAVWQGSVLLQALILAALRTPCAPRLLQGFFCCFLKQMGSQSCGTRHSALHSVPKPTRVAQPPCRRELPSARRAAAESETGQLSVLLLTFSSCCSSGAGSCDSCSTTPTGTASLPPPAP